MVPANIAVYSAIYGNYERPKPPPRGVKAAFMFTDDRDVRFEAIRLGWMPIYLRHYVATLRGSAAVTGPMLAHKWWKTHPESMDLYEASIWIDGSMEVTVDDFVARCIEALGDDDMALMRHPARNCIYPEAEFSATLERYDKPSILAQVESYRAFHPPEWGLIATGHMVRRHTPAVIELSHHWWDECINWSHQDQLSLLVLLRLAEDKVKWNVNIPWHEWWTLHEHGS